MKKITLLLAGALVSAVALASEPGEGSKGLAVVKKNSTTFNLLYQPASSTTVKVAILNEQGEEVYSESIKHTDGFVRPYNFEKLSEGKYTIKVVDGDETMTKTVSYTNARAPKAANVLRLADGRYLVSVRGAEASGKVTVNIFSGYQLLHKQIDNVTGDFGQVFTLKNAPDDISFEVLNSKGKKIN